jgi:DNA-binding transcriptional LysR family regulator
MDLLPLRYFQAVARREHISQAADDLRVAQPSLSRAIARLEADLGVPLFDRQGRQVRLNRFGAAFLRRVDRALGELDDARKELADAAGLTQGSVAIAAETLLTLTALLARFRAKHPGVSVRLFQSSAETMAHQLGTREIDLCLASQPLTGPALRKIELLREEVLLAVPPTHPLAGCDRTDMAALAAEPFITTRPGHWQRVLADRLFKEAGLRPNIVCEGDEPGAIQDLISAGLGVGLLPVMSRQAATHAPVAWLHLDAPHCCRRLSVVWRDDAYLSTAAQRFRDLAIEHFQQPSADS